MSTTIEIVREFEAWREQRTLSNKPDGVDDYEEYLEVRGLIDTLKEIREILSEVPYVVGDDLDRISNKVEAALATTVSFELDTRLPWGEVAQ